jgi:hypothetical protein
LFQVTVGNISSTKMNIEHKIVQVVVISVTLFLIAMTGFCKGMDKPSKMMGYTDDWMTRSTNYQEWQKANLKKQQTKSLNGLMKMNLEYQPRRQNRFSSTKKIES